MKGTQVSIYERHYYYVYILQMNKYTPNYVSWRKTSISIDILTRPLFRGSIVMCNVNLFSWHHMVSLVCDVLVGYGFLLAALLRPNPPSQLCEFGFWHVFWSLTSGEGPYALNHKCWDEEPAHSSGKA